MMSYPYTISFTATLQRSIIDSKSAAGISRNYREGLVWLASGSKATTVPQLARSLGFQ